jgi:Na+/H+-dicarboxylate symporter
MVLHLVNSGAVVLLGNLIGNCVATAVIAAWEKELDLLRARRVLDGDTAADVTTNVRTEPDWRL